MADPVKDFSIAGLAAQVASNRASESEVANNDLEASGVKPELDYSQDSEKEETTEGETTEVVDNSTEDKTEAEAETTEEETTEGETTDSSLNTEETSTEATEETEKKPLPTFEEELATRTDGKYSTIEEMVEAISQKEETPAFEYGNELIAKMDELAKKGVSVDRQFIMDQMVDYSVIDHTDRNQALDLVRKQMKLDDPEISDKLMNYDIQDRYKLDPDEYSEAEIERSEAMLERDARRAKKQLIENQESNQLPTGGVDPEVARQQQEAADRQREKVTTTLKSTLNEYKSEAITIGKEEFKFEFDADVKALIEKDVLNTDKRYSRYVDKDGNIDSKQLATDEAWANPKIRTKMLNAYLKQAISTGSSEVVGDLKNSSLDTTKNPKPTQKDFSVNAAIQNHFMKKR